MSTTTQQQAEMDRLEARLQRLERKVDELLDAHRRRAELVEELMPIGREVMAVWSQQLEALERRGYVAFGREVLRVLDRVVESYSEEDVRALGDNIVTILDTVRNVTQPEVLEVANEAVEVIGKPEEVEPVGVLGMLRSTRDDDVKRGMAVLLEVLRHLGRAAERMGEQEGERRRPPPPRKPRPAADVEVPAAAEAPPAAPSPAAPEPAPQEEASVPSAEGADGESQDGWQLDDDGHLADPSQWSPDFAEAMAMHLGLGELSEEQWAVVRWVRKEWEEQGAAPNIRRITTGMGIETRKLYQLFPKAPARTVAKIAGIPKPVGCL